MEEDTGDAAREKCVERQNQRDRIRGRSRRLSWGLTAWMKPAGLLTDVKQQMDTQGKASESPPSSTCDSHNGCAMDGHLGFSAGAEGVYEA
ncbi:hypothetical protein CesoFtcFv8_027568 [Champsocephalus esox]|nr:hypothetical protein CesoFtcFv8_027568 [Champsocephalus esox]